MEIVNNYDSALLQSITDTATTLDVLVAPIGITPTPASPLTVTVFNSAVREILHCTNLTGTTMTVIRAREGTTAIAWSGTTPVAAMLTAGVVAETVGRGLGILEEITGSATVALNGIINLPSIGVMMASGQQLTLPGGTTATVTGVGNNDQITVSGHTPQTYTGDFAAIVPDGRKLRYFNGQSVWRT